MSDQKPTDEQFSYISHIQIETLMSAMKQITPHPEEHLFVTVHQSLEIWFKHFIFDMRRVIAHLGEDRIPEANWLLKRLGEILRLADTHWTVLETMSTADFHEFRPYLTGASGMQSRNFREVEVMCGLCEVADDAYRDRVRTMWPGMMEEYPVTLRTAFFGVVERSGLTLTEIYARRWEKFDLFSLCENAVEIDRRFQTWRHNHVMMVRRQIGMSTRGTGGTIGRDYLASTLGYLFFPELWELRHEISALHGGEVVRDD